MEDDGTHALEEVLAQGDGGGNGVKKKKKKGWQRVVEGVLVDEDVDPWQRALLAVSQERIGEECDIVVCIAVSHFVC